MKKHHEKEGHMKKRADGGQALGNDMEHDKKGPVNGYTPKDVPVVKEANEEKDSFHKGGKTKKRKEGGHVDGKKPHHRLDKKASGGRMSGGHSPMTAAADLKGRPGGVYDGGDKLDREDD